MNILFIGNSFTFYNDMPSTIQQMCNISGIDAKVEQVTYGGYTLSKYLGEDKEATKEVMNKLCDTKWDYVILQEFSNRPLVDNAKFIQSVIQLNKFIKMNGAKTLLYSTWSYRDGSKKLENDAGVTYDEFYNRLKDAYNEAGRIIVSPVIQIGTAFDSIHKKFKDIDLLMDDDYHPSPDGSYVIAAMFYLTFFGKNVLPEYIPSDVSKLHIDILREVALENANYQVL